MIRSISPMLHIHWAPFSSFLPNWFSLLQMTKWLMNQSVSVRYTISFNGCPITNETRGVVQKLISMTLTLLCTLANLNLHLTNLQKNFSPFKHNHCSLWKLVLLFLEPLFNLCPFPQTSDLVSVSSWLLLIHRFQEVHKPPATEWKKHNTHSLFTRL